MESNIVLEGVATILGILGTGLGIFGITAYITERMKHKAKKRNAKEDAREEMEERMNQEQLTAALRSVVKEETAPFIESFNLIHQDIREIKEDLAKNTEGTVTALRDRMHCSGNYCKRQGWASYSDKANWGELYKEYRKLGGDHFKEYVDQGKRGMESLPERPDEEEK